MTNKPKKKTLYSRAKQILQKEGFMPFLKQVASFFGRRIVNYNKQYLYEEILDKEVTVPPHRLDNLIIKPIYIPTMSQLEYEATFYKYDQKGEFFDFLSQTDMLEDIPNCSEGLNEGMVILYCTLDGEFVHRNAVTLSGKGNDYENLHNRIKSPFYSLDDKRTVYRALCVTNPKYGGKGIYTHVEFTMHNFMKKKGYSKLVFTVNPSMVLDLIIFDGILYPNMNAKAMLKVYRIKLFKIFKTIIFKRCKKQPLDELRIPRKLINNKK